VSRTGGADAADIGERADEILKRVRPFLGRESAEVQGAVIADMAALWLAGHRVEGDRAEGDRLRAELLAMHAAHVRELAAMYLDGVDG